MESSVINTNLSDDSLQLVITEKTLGKLITNAQQIHDMVQKSMPKYDVKNYTDENIDQAKKDKAALNKAAKALNDKRIELEGEFNKPFAEFKAVITDTVTLIKQCSGKIDEVVKANEQIYKERKRLDIETLYKTLNAPVELDKIWDDRWLNKSVTLKKVSEEIDKSIKDVKDKLNYIWNLCNDDSDTYNVLKAQFFLTMDLNKTLDYFQQLKVTKDAEEKRKAAELDAHNNAIQSGNARVQVPQQPQMSAPQAVAQPINSVTESENSITQNPDNDDILTRYFTVTCSKSKIIALSDFLNDNDIDFDKIEIEDSLCKTDRKVIVDCLDFAKKFIEEHSTSSREVNKARIMGNLIKKINGSLA